MKPANQEVPEADFSDAELIGAYQRTSGQPDDEQANRLLVEIERRNLDL